MHTAVSTLSRRTWCFFSRSAFMDRLIHRRPEQSQDLSRLFCLHVQQVAQIFSRCTLYIHAYWMLRVESADAQTVFLEKTCRWELMSRLEALRASVMNILSETYNFVGAQGGMSWPHVFLMIIFERSYRRRGEKGVPHEGQNLVELACCAETAATTRQPHPSYQGAAVFLLDIGTRLRKSVQFDTGAEKFNHFNYCGQTSCFPFLVSACFLGLKKRRSLRIRIRCSISNHSWNIVGRECWT